MLLTEITNWLKDIGIGPGQNIIVHASFRALRTAFTGISPGHFFDAIKSLVTPSGSIIFPAFTYCFKKTAGDQPVFNPAESVSLVGALSEAFRKEYDVIRTSSPTHSFAVWGSITRTINESNSPASPLGAGSVLEYLARTPGSHVLLLATDFSSLSLLHYIENTIPLPYLHVNPWEYLNVLPAGVSVDSEQALCQLPGCSQSFVRFWKYPSEKQLAKETNREGIPAGFYPVNFLIEHAVKYLLDNPAGLLCEAGKCKACDSRRGHLVNCGLI